MTAATAATAINMTARFLWRNPLPRAWPRKPRQADTRLSAVSSCRKDPSSVAAESLADPNQFHSKCKKRLIVLDKHWFGSPTRPRPGGAAAN